MIELPSELQDVKVLIGLGNPGPQYEMTRHNVGFMFLDRLAELAGASWSMSHNMLIAEIPGGVFPFFSRNKLLLCKPQTFMNSSGNVMRMLSKQGVELAQTLVVHDELEKKVGTFAIRQGGSARGHNGLRSIMALAGPDFRRLRIGIDRPADKSEVSNYVLSKFAPDELIACQLVFDKVIQLLETPVVASD